MPVSELNNAYASFFSKAGKFAISPYTAAFYDTCGLSREDQDDTSWIVRAMVGGPICAALTVIPVLPIATAVTASLALASAIIAALSALIAYPVAAVMDAFLSPTAPTF
jgi:mannose/fructose/N-acetylgalactosamine-specific phosphotransferase system component IID